MSDTANSHELLPDFYELIPLDRSRSTTELTTQLLKLELQLRAKLGPGVDAPDLQRTYDLVKQAKPHFVDDAARAAYDRRLEEQQHEDETDWGGMLEQALSMGDTSLAADIAQQAERQTKDPHVMRAVASAWLTIGDAKRADEVARQRIILTPNDPAAYRDRGDLLLGRLSTTVLPQPPANPDLVVKMYQKAIELSPNESDPIAIDSADKMRMVSLIARLQQDKAYFDNQIGPHLELDPELNPIKSEGLDWRHYRLHPEVYEAQKYADAAKNVAKECGERQQAAHSEVSGLKVPENAALGTAWEALAYGEATRHSQQALDKAKELLKEKAQKEEDARKQAQANRAKKAIYSIAHAVILFALFLNLSGTIAHIPVFIGGSGIYSFPAVFTVIYFICALFCGYIAWMVLHIILNAFLHLEDPPAFSALFIDLAVIIVTFLPQYAAMGF